MKKLFLWIGALACGVVIACTTKKPAPPPTAVVDVNVPVAAPADGGEFEALAYGATASTRYAEAESLAHQQRWDEAIRVYNQIKATWHYSKYASLSELRIADVAFARGNWTDAKVRYREWTRAHRSNTLLVEAITKRADSAECREAGDLDCVDSYDAGL